jgi:uncharacterized Tic20 family protein
LPRFGGAFLCDRKERHLKRLGNILAWAFFGLSVLSLVAWPLMIWWHVKGGAPFVPAMLETLPYPIGAILFWIVARGLKMSTSLAPRS